MTESRLRADTEASVEPPRDADHERRRQRNLEYVKWVRDTMRRARRDDPRAAKRSAATRGVMGERYEKPRKDAKR